MGHIPYGYRIENGLAVIDEDQAARVKQLYEGYLAGLGLKNAAESAGLSVTHCQAKRMMLNEKYLGTEYYPAIVTKELMEKARVELQKRATALGRNYEPKPKEEKHTISTFLLGRVDNRFTDPYEQAEYAYSLIEEVQTDG